MLIEVQGLSKRYRPRGPMVVEEISFTIDRGETLAIFGDSGSGKSTIGQILAGIYPATAGEVWLDGQRLSYPLRGPARRRIQILFQHPEVAFNPKLRLIDSMREPYRLFHLPYTRQGLCDYLERYGIYEEHLDRFPAELSGGELQRLALARAMLMDPSFLVLDEPTSMLDVISQAQVIQLLQEIQQEREVGYLFISHDRALCERFCTAIRPLEGGRCRFTRITVLLCCLLTKSVICAIIPHMKRQTRYKDVLISRQRGRCLSLTTVTKTVATWNIRPSGFRRFPTRT